MHPPTQQTAGPPDGASLRLARPWAQDGVFRRTRADHDGPQGPAAAKVQEPQTPQEVAETREFSRNGYTFKMVRHQGLEPRTR